MSYCGMDHGILDYLVNLDPGKHGQFMGGNQLEIHPPIKLLEDHPDYVLILPWNLADELATQLGEYRRRGGKLIVPAPLPRVVS